MNKYIYKVRFVSQEQKLCKILNNKQFNYNFNRKNDGKKIMKYFEKFECFMSILMKVS